MQPRILYWILASLAVVLSRCNAATETKEATPKDKTSGSTPYNSQDDIYLEDQEGIEGSGRGTSDIRDDLEASGSGLGPDDEDGDDDTEVNIHNTIEPVANKPVEPKVPPIDETIFKTKPTSVETENRPENGINKIEPTVGEDEHTDETENNRGVYIMNPKHEDRASSFFAQPGVLAAVIGGAVVGLLCAILVVMFIVYRMRKKDEGSYALDEPRRSPAAHAYPKPGAPHHNREFYA